MRLDFSVTYCDKCSGLASTVARPLTLQDRYSERYGSVSTVNIIWLHFHMTQLLGHNLWY